MNCPDCDGKLYSVSYTHFEYYCNKCGLIWNIKIVGEKING